MDSFDSDNWATLPLTQFDRLFERTTFLTGWLVEGTIDADALARALTHLTHKWRMLAGRLESVPSVEDGATEWRIRIPLGPIPADYKTFALTTATSDVPLSHHLALPLPTVSRSLPHALFIHPSTPRQYTVWESTRHPLTCWHLTHFPPDPKHGGTTHTCIGFARSHGVFDGVGAGQIVRALVQEMKGEPWDVPALPSPGFTPNPVQSALDAAVEQGRGAEGEGEGKGTDGYSGFTDLGVGGAVKQVAWHLRERLWYEADRRIVLVPKDVLDYLVESVRGEPRSEASDNEVTTGDILVAWILKTVYAAGTSPTTLIQCSNLASFRHLLSPSPSASTALLHYPHNAFVPLPYPPLSLHELTTHTLAALARRLAAARGALAIRHVLSAYGALRSVTAFPANPRARETVVVSNVEASRILEADWRGVIRGSAKEEGEASGSGETGEGEGEGEGDERETGEGKGKTLCGYRYQLTPTELLMTNGVYVSGRLGDGSVVLDVSLRKRRVEMLERAVAGLAREVGKAPGAV
ncbi:putative lysr family regulatory protein [Lyophyllum shimeji]|uniref:Lysr family regulatory protein n=1 Tax=Lyophyllum shimeji TaxID=47721 RepID=A0A9P3PD27_LYOSH|nr:putative lysr family regulatory protein [Lyophyllum shimeji]